MSEIAFKDMKVLRAMFTVAWHPYLIALLMWLKVRYHKTSVVITDAYRDGDKGVHGSVPLRGLDLRSTVFENPQQICDDINNEWLYDPKRPDMKVAILHDIGKGIHIHLQVHPNTIWVKNGAKNT